MAQSEQLEALLNTITPITGMRLSPREDKNKRTAARGGMVQNGFINELSSIMGYPKGR